MKWKSTHRHPHPNPLPSNGRGRRCDCRLKSGGRSCIRRRAGSLAKVASPTAIPGKHEIHPLPAAGCLSPGRSSLLVFRAAEQCGSAVDFVHAETREIPNSNPKRQTPNSKPQTPSSKQFPKPNSQWASNVRRQSVAADAPVLGNWPIEHWVLFGISAFGFRISAFHRGRERGIGRAQAPERTRGGNGVMGRQGQDAGNGRHGFFN